MTNIHLKLIAENHFYLGHPLTVDQYTQIKNSRYNYLLKLDDSLSVFDLVSEGSIQSNHDVIEEAKRKRIPVYINDKNELLGIISNIDDIFTEHDYNIPLEAVKGMFLKQLDTSTVDTRIKERAKAAAERSLSAAGLIAAVELIARM